MCPKLYTPGAKSFGSGVPNSGSQLLRMWLQPLNGNTRDAAMAAGLVLGPPQPDVVVQTPIYQLMQATLPTPTDEQPSLQKLS